MNFDWIFLQAEKVRLELQEEYDNIQIRLEETTGKLHAAESYNIQRKEEVRIWPAVS